MDIKHSPIIGSNQRKQDTFSHLSYEIYYIRDEMRVGGGGGVVIYLTTFSTLLFIYLFIYCSFV